MSYEQYRPSGFSLLTPVIKNLLIINAILFLATIVFENRFGIDLSDLLGLHYIQAEKFKPYQLITYMFMHGGFTHLFFNMFALWMFGNVLENYWGSKRFLTYYLITGVGAAFTHYVIFYFNSVQPMMQVLEQYAQAPDLVVFEIFFKEGFFKASSEEMRLHITQFIDEYNALELAGKREDMLQASLDFVSLYKADFFNAPVVVGASGAVFGILLAFGMMFPNTLLYIYFAIPIKAKYFVILYGAMELFYGLRDTPGDNVAHFAHLGGMLFGFFLILFWKKKTNTF